MVPQRCGWDMLKHLLSQLELEARKDETCRQLESSALYELAKAEKSEGNIFPWREIKAQLKRMYHPQLLEPLFSIIGSDDGI